MPLKRRKSLPSDLSSLTLTSTHPIPAPTATEKASKSEPYSFLTIVLDGFANEPVPLWRERGNPCPRLDEIIGREGRAQPSTRRRKSAASIGEQHNSETFRQASHTRTRSHIEQWKVPGECDLWNGMTELSTVEAVGSELVNPAQASNVVSSFYYRYLKRFASEQNLSRILAKGPRPNTSPGRSFFVSPRQIDTLEETYRPPRLSQPVSADSAPVPTTPIPSFSFPLALPCLVPLPASPYLDDPSPNCPSGPPSLSSSLCSLDSSVLLSFPPTPISVNFAASIQVDMDELLKGDGETLE